MTGPARRIGVCTIAAADTPRTEVFAAARDAGSDFVELTGRRPHLADDASPGEVERVRREAEEAGIELACYGSYLGFGGPPDADHAERVLGITAGIGARFLRVWAGFDEGTDAARHLTRLGDRARDLGITVVVERHTGGRADTPERVEALLDEVDHPAVRLNWQPLDDLPADRAAGVADDAALLAPRTAYVHVKNYDRADGRLVLGGDLERGALDWRAVLAALDAAGYAGPLAVEFVRADDPRPLAVRLGEAVSWLRTLVRPRPEPGTDA